jgi:hypothetical protein
VSIPILVEPGPTGFLAKTGGPLDLSAEAASAAEAVRALQEKIARRLEGGAMIIDQPIRVAQSPIPITPLKENPLFEEWLAAVETFRAQQESQHIGPAEVP